MGASSLGRLTRWPAAAQVDVKAIFMGLPVTTGSIEGRPAVHRQRLLAIRRYSGRAIAPSHVVVIEVPTAAF
jgi:hypothetical protein